MSSSFSSLARSLYRRRIVESEAAAYSSRLPPRARPPARPRIAASANTTSDYEAVGDTESYGPQIWEA
nr:unnamed protein product [Digitaria exilis]